MPDTGVVFNPFTRKEYRLRRNTRDGKWVAVDDEECAVQLQQERCESSRKRVEILMQQEGYARVYVLESNGEDAGSSQSSEEDGGGEVSPWTQQVPASSRLQRCCSSSVVDGQVELPRGTVTADTTPTETTAGAGVGAVSKKHEDEKGGGGKENLASTLSSFYRSAKAIYEIGPEGEGHQMWQAVQDIRKAVSSMTPRPQAQDSTVAAYKMKRLNPTMRENSRQSESGISYRSRDVPLGIDRSICREVDVDKPLPSIPKLDPAPKTRGVMAAEGAYMVGVAGAGMPYPTKWEGNFAQRMEAGPGISKDSSASPWWKSVAGKQPVSAHDILKAGISCPGPLMASNGGRTANVAVRCGGIGGPAAAVSLPVDRYGVPLPTSAYTKRETVKTSPLLTFDQLYKSRKDKQKGSDDCSLSPWRDKFHALAVSAGKLTPDRIVGRKSSDLKFKCRGLENDASSPVHAHGAVHWTQPYSSLDSNSNRRDMVPEPLFQRKTRKV